VLLAFTLVLLDHSHLYLGRLNSLYLVGVLVFTAVTSFIMGVEMRRKIRKDLGRKATDLDLAGIDTWIEVDEAEEKAAKERARHGPIDKLGN
jgi:hypothetical protein